MSAQNQSGSETNFSTNEQQDHNRQQKQGQEYKDGIFNRWCNHLILNFLLETSDAIRIGTSAINPPMLTRWFVIFSGILIGGNGVIFLQWAFMKLSEYSEWIAYLLAASLIFLGPDAIPPLTPLNGCESMSRRFVCTVAFIGLEKMKSNIPIVHSWSCTTSLFVISGLWHMDRADYDFRQAHRATLDMMRQHSQNSEEMMQGIVHVFLQYYFQAGAGIGMLWAVLNVYTSSIFFWSIVIYGGINAVIYYLYVLELLR
jgi:hypothetical protein